MNRALLILLLTFYSVTVFSQSAIVDISKYSELALGKFVRFTIDSDKQYSFYEILNNKTISNYGKSDALGFGIGHPPVWAHIRLLNPEDNHLKRFIRINPSWTDFIDVYIIQAGVVIEKLKMGDAIPDVPYLNAATGYLFEHDFSTGITDLIFRIETHDPMLVDLRLYDNHEIKKTEAILHYSYGFLYGFIFALIAYNMMVFVKIRQRNYLYYSLFLSSIMMTNIAYTGHGMVWFWSDSIYFERYVILIFMVISACVGLQFTKVFLELHKLSGRLVKVINGFILASITTLMITIIFDLHQIAAWFSFIDIGIYIFAIIPISIFALIKRHKAAGYFLLAAIFSMVGMGLTLLSVWGLIPFNMLSYRGMELGIMLEAVLLAFALAQFVRLQVLEKEVALASASTDSLTGLLNRRGFLERASLLIGELSYSKQPISCVMVDIDYFKSINDTYGHDAGDSVLRHFGKILTSIINEKALIARWGGEEFIILLPEIDLDEAVKIAEKVRYKISETSFSHQNHAIQLTSSLGVTEADGNYDINTLIKSSDSFLYSAKEQGRNRVIQKSTATLIEPLSHCSSC